MSFENDLQTSMQRAGDAYDLPAGDYGKVVRSGRRRKAVRIGGSTLAIVAIVAVAIGAIVSLRGGGGMDPADRQPLSPSVTEISSELTAPPVPEIVSELVAPPTTELPQTTTLEPGESSTTMPPAMKTVDVAAVGELPSDLLVYADQGTVVFVDLVRGREAARILGSVEPLWDDIFLIRDVDGLPYFITEGRALEEWTEVFPLPEGYALDFTGPSAPMLTRLGEVVSEFPHSLDQSRWAVNISFGEGTGLIDNRVVDIAVPREIVLPLGCTWQTTDILSCGYHGIDTDEDGDEIFVGDPRIERYSGSERLLQSTDRLTGEDHVILPSGVWADDFDGPDVWLSLDGATLLIDDTTRSDAGCAVSRAFTAPTGGGEAAWALDQFGNVRARGWTSSGEIVVTSGIDNQCEGSTNLDPGVYAYDPATETLRTIVRSDDGSERSFFWATW